MLVDYKFLTTECFLLFFLMANLNLCSVFRGTLFSKSKLHLYRQHNLYWVYEENDSLNKYWNIFCNVSLWKVLIFFIFNFESQNKMTNFTVSKLFCHVRCYGFYFFNFFNPWKQAVKYLVLLGLYIHRLTEF